jgi:hypothetical protein
MQHFLMIEPEKSFFISETSRRCVHALYSTVMAKIKTLREALDERNREIAMRFVKGANGRSLRKWAKANSIELTMAHRAVKQWREWCERKIAGEMEDKSA